MKTLHFDPSSMRLRGVGGATMLTPQTPSSAPTLGATVDRLAAVGQAEPPTLGEVGPGRTSVLPLVFEHAGQLRLQPRECSRYTTRRRLGAGGMGEVDLSDDLDIGRPVAIKRLPAGAPSALAVARFIDEVRAMGSLDHPNITPIYDVGRDDDGRLFFAMKYVDGESLESLLSRLAAGDAQAHADYPFARRLDIFTGILHALDYAHAQGVLHRDIKPANVMLGRHGEVHLVDWGIAGRTPQAGMEPTDAGALRPGMTEHGKIPGTPWYMSPEQASGDAGAIGPRSDLYSAFVVLFELLTLRRYVRAADTTVAILQEVLSGDAPPVEGPIWLHPHQPATPIELRHFLRRGLRQRADQRFPSVAEALVFLERLRSGEIAIDCPVTFFKAGQTRIAKIADRSPALFSSVLVAAAAASVTLVVFAGYGLKMMMMG